MHFNDFGVYEVFGLVQDTCDLYKLTDSLRRRNVWTCSVEKNWCAVSSFFFFCMCAPFHDVTSTPFVPRDMRTPLTHRDCNGNLWVFTKWHNTKDWTDYKQCPPKLQQLTGALIGVLDQRRSQRFFYGVQTEPKPIRAVESVLLTHYLVNLTTSTFTVTKRCSRNPNYWNIRKIS